MSWFGESDTASHYLFFKLDNIILWEIRMQNYFSVLQISLHYTQFFMLSNTAVYMCRNLSTFFQLNKCFLDAHEVCGLRCSMFSRDPLQQGSVFNNISFRKIFVQCVYTPAWALSFCTLYTLFQILLLVWFLLDSSVRFSSYYWKFEKLVPAQRSECGFFTPEFFLTRNISP